MGSESRGQSTQCKGVICPGELGHWLDAESWAEAHQTLIKSLAARWFTGGDKDLKNLKDALRRLASHSAAIDEANGVYTFQHGAGLYLEYHSIKVKLLHPIQATSYSLGKSTCLLPYFQAYPWSIGVEQRMEQTILLPCIAVRVTREQFQKGQSRIPSQRWPRCAYAMVVMIAGRMKWTMLDRSLPALI